MLAQNTQTNSELTISTFYESLREPIRKVFLGKEFIITGDVENINPFMDHLYISLLDNSAGKISRITVFVPYDIRALGDNISIGSKIRVTGLVAVGRNGIQLRATGYELLGVGLMEKLKNEWMRTFEYLINGNKPKLPLFYPNIALITNPEIQGYEDFDRHLTYGKVKIWNTKMQGSDVAANIANAIREINDIGGFDCICLVRGGGSDAELFEYNRPELLEAIGNSEIPVITAIGHESDEPLCDLVASKRCSTPTSAAVFFSSQAVSLLSNVESLDKEIRARVYQIASNRASFDKKQFFVRYKKLIKIMMGAGALIVIHYALKILIKPGILL